MEVEQVVPKMSFCERPISIESVVATFGMKRMMVLRTEPRGEGKAFMLDGVQTEGTLQGPGVKKAGADEMA